ncbi:unnamed protein product [Brachionus calyciflorus]|uniref:MULE transposase domain-containing protein n=1 Tax=Brachionus calyciflorus TaxID=104777 RepID=A0A814J1N1_9BILA|nr:unnamed protein product [Brachionus calyciflorus]
MASSNEFEYVQSNTYKLEHDSELNLSKDGFEVLAEKFLYCRRKKNKSSNYWVCKHKNCTASLTIDFDGKIISRSVKTHNIVENALDTNDIHVPLTEYQILSMQFLKKVKIRCSTEDTGSNKIFEDEVNQLFKKLVTDTDKQEMALMIPQFHSVKAGLQKRKTVLRPKMPTSVLTTVVEGKYTKCVNDIDNFLIYKTKRNKKLVFCSKIGLEILSNSPEWHADGTFHVATKYYHQLYIIQAWFKGRMIPCAFILMERRRTKDYEDVLKALKRASHKNNLILNPQKIMTDLELAAINAFKTQFPSIITKSCLFHFAQALFRNFVK